VLAINLEGARAIRFQSSANTCQDTRLRCCTRPISLGAWRGSLSSDAEFNFTELHMSGTTKKAKVVKLESRKGKSLQVLCMAEAWMQSGHLICP